MREILTDEQREALRCYVDGLWSIRQSSPQAESALRDLGFADFCDNDDSASAAAKVLLALDTRVRADAGRVGDTTRNALVAFALDFLREHRNDGEPGDVDGGWCEDTAIRHGLLVHVPVAAPCGEGCKCSEYDGEDGICLRPSPAVAALLAHPTPTGAPTDG